MENYKYGKLEDIERMKSAGEVGGVHTCRLDKMPHGKLVSMYEAGICDIDHPLASTVTARYYKEIGAHKDNMVMEIWKLKRK